MENKEKYQVSYSKEYDGCILQTEIFDLDSLEEALNLVKCVLEENPDMRTSGIYIMKGVYLDVESLIEQ